MSTKRSRSGGKFTGSHTTVIPAAGIIADICAKSDAVDKISISIIHSGLRPAKGQRRLKILEEQACLILKVRDNISIQELRVYAWSLREATAAIIDGAKRAGFLVTMRDGKPV